MTNPVLAKSQAFSARPLGGFAPPSDYGPGWNQSGAPGYGPTGQPGAPGQSPYDPRYLNQPGQAPYDPQYAGQPGPAGAPSWQMATPSDTQQVMTLDDVLTKTALTIGTTVVIAIGAAWTTIALHVPIQTLWVAGIICALATVIFPFVVYKRRKIGPAIALGFAVLEGVMLGAFSLIFEMVYPGIVLQAVLATFIAAGATLAAFKFGNFRLTTRMRKIVMMSVIAYAGMALTSLVLNLLGINLGLFPGPGQPVHWFAWLAAGIGVVLAVLSLVDDFQYVERGIANGVPSSESWRAAYGLTVTLVWLYINLLRILSYLRR